MDMRYSLWMSMMLVSYVLGNEDLVFPRSAETQLLVDMKERLSVDGVKEVLAMVRPVADEEPLNVTVIFQLKQILDFDEKSQKVKIDFDLNYIWFNYHMTWRPEDYGGLKHMRYPKSEIWIPDIILNFNVASYNPSPMTSEYLIIEYDGTVTQSEPVIYTVGCPVIMLEFPFDTQKCTLVWGSWEYSRDYLNIIVPGKVMDLSKYLPNQEWDLLNTSVTRVDTVTYEPDAVWYSNLEYEFSVKRKSGAYEKLILVPTGLLSLLMFVVFWIAAVRPDRCALPMGILYSFMLLLLLVVAISPPTTGVKLGLYYMTAIFLVVISIVTSSISVACSSKQVQMNRMIRKVFVDFIGVKLGLFRQYDYMMRHDLIRMFSSGTTDLLNKIPQKPNIERKEIDMDELDPYQKLRMECRRDWQVAAAVLDRCIFVVFAIVTFSCFGAYFPIAIK